MKFFELKMRLIAPWVVLCCFVYLCGAAPAQAQETFEHGFPPPSWIYSGVAGLGGVATSTSGITPAGGTAHFGWISTGCLAAAGTSCPTVATAATPSYAMLGLSNANTAMLGAPTTETVLTSAPFTLQPSNTTISFDVNFITTDGTNAFADFTLVQLIPSVGTPIDLFVANTTGATSAAVPPVDLNAGVGNLSPAPPVFFTGATVMFGLTTYGNVPKFGGGNPSCEPTSSGPNAPCPGGPTGWIHVTYVAAAGTYTLRFYVSHVGDTNYPSALAINNVVTPTPRTPTSGALLTINGTVSSGSVVVNRNIYDSQIHTGTVRQVPVGTGGSNCNANDQSFPTDAYVLQGGSWTGCDPGDPFETSQGTGMASIKNDATGTLYNFGISTVYTSTPKCNHNNSICVGVNGVTDTGFLTVTNSSTSAFSGTITLSGNSVLGANNALCTASASDTFTAGLAAGASVTLALNNDNSFCGGFNAPQTQPLAVTNIFPIGTDDYQITAVSAPGDMLTVLPIPVPAGPLTGTTYGFEMGLPSLSSRFSATNYPNQACIAYKTLSALGNPVCLDVQVHCKNGLNPCADAANFLYTSRLDFTKDPNSLSTIGGTAFLGQHLVDCPTTGFNQNVFFKYTPTSPDPLDGDGSGDGSCYVGTFDPNAAPVPVGQTLTQETLVGFLPPVNNCTGIYPTLCGTVNPIQMGRSWTLKWQTFSDSASTVPVTNLSFCTNTAGTGCATPWAFVGTIPVDCTTSAPIGTFVQPATKGASGFQNLGAAGTDPPGTYAYNVDTGTVMTPTGCFTPVVGFSFGFWSWDRAVAQFK